MPAVIPRGCLIWLGSYYICLDSDGSCSPGTESHKTPLKINSRTGQQGGPVESHVCGPTGGEEWRHQEVGEIASLPGESLPEDIGEQFPGLRYMIEPGPEWGTHWAAGLDHTHPMSEHAAESSKSTSQLRLMRSMFATFWLEKEPQDSCGVLRWRPAREVRLRPARKNDEKSA